VNVLIDSSAWIEYLRATGTRFDALVTAAIEGGTAAVAEPTRMEVLAGSFPGRSSDAIGALLDGCHQLVQLPRTDVESAASLYRTCWRAGETVRSLTDCLIAAIAIRHDVAVLHHDRDFDVLARHTELKVVCS
jgi:predicted nucleic acid-binding protein